MPRRGSTTSRTRSNGTAAGATPEAAGAVPPFKPAAGEVKIRMYGQGLGDCFLLAFPRTPKPGARRKADDRPVYVVIDCGVIGGTPDGPDRMKAIVRDIAETTRDDSLPKDSGKIGHVDVLAITHEHWDHLSGFVQAEKEWDQIQVDAIWTAWTEDPNDHDLPDVLKKILEKQKKALEAAANRTLRFGLGDQHEMVLGLMSFLSDDEGLGMPFGKTAGTGDAFKIAKGLAATKVYCEPGDVRPVPGTEAVAYVLGPPRNDDRLRQMDPKKADPETYDNKAQAAGADGDTADDDTDGGAESGPAPRRGRAAQHGFADPDASFSLRSMAESRSAFNAFALPLVGPPLHVAEAAADPTAHGVAETDRDLYELSFPFDRTRRVALPLAEDEVTSHPTKYPALAAYFDEINSWRRVDFDWLAGADVFALQADSLTNNTCLVLAFELPKREAADEPKVLLFVGDAQVGNWISWDEIDHWTPRDGAMPSQSKVNIPDLMKRVTFYKVGHHGSHNATLKARGVERMPDVKPLTAFVPVSPAVARDVKDWCQMPLDVLLNALHERTHGRVILATGDVWQPTIGTVRDLSDAEKRRQQQDIGFEVSATLLPEKIRTRDKTRLEGPVPLWVQTTIEY